MILSLCSRCVTAMRACAPVCTSISLPSAIVECDVCSARGNTSPDEGVPMCDDFPCATEVVIVRGSIKDAIAIVESW